MLGIPDKYAMERGGWETDCILKSVYQQTFSAERQEVDRKIDAYFESLREAWCSQVSNNKKRPSKLFADDLFLSVNVLQFIYLFFV